MESELLYRALLSGQDIKFRIQDARRDIALFLEDRLHHEVPITSEYIDRVIRHNTSFSWFDRSKPWAGLTQTGLVEKVVHAAKQLSFTPAQARGTRIIFADHMIILLGDPQTKEATKEIESGTHIASPDSRGDKIRRCTVYLNRSSEVARYSSHQAIRQRDDVSSAELEFIIKQPEQFIDWAIFEELSHAKAWHIAGSYTRANEWRGKYRDSQQTKGRQNLSDRSLDVFEIAASRTVLRMLAQEYPADRLELLELHRKSVQSGHCVIPNTSEVFDKLFIPTGFDPRVI